MKFFIVASIFSDGVSISLADGGEANFFITIYSRYNKTIAFHLLASARHFGEDVT